MTKPRTRRPKPRKNRINSTRRSRVEFPSVLFDQVYLFMRPIKGQGIRLSRLSYCNGDKRAKPCSSANVQNLSRACYKLAEFYCALCSCHALYRELHFFPPERLIDKQPVKTSRCPLFKGSSFIDSAASKD